MCVRHVATAQLGAEDGDVFPTFTQLPSHTEDVAFQTSWDAVRMRSNVPDVTTERRVLLTDANWVYASSRKTKCFPRFRCFEDQNVLFSYL